MLRRPAPYDELLSAYYKARGLISNDVLDKLYSSSLNLEELVFSSEMLVSNLKRT